jgi:hypothetical protein
VLLVDDVEVDGGSAVVVGASVELVDVVGGVVVLTTVEVDVVGSHVQPAEQTSPGAHVNAPPGELGSHGSPASTMPFPHDPTTVVVVVDVVVVEDVLEVEAVVVDVVVDSHVHTTEHTSPGAHVNTPVGELASHGSPESTTPFPQFPGTVVDDVLGVGVVVVVVVDSHVHAPEHTSPGAHVNAPVGELASHGSPASTTPFPHVPATVVVVVDDDVVVVVVVDDDVVVVVAMVDVVVVEVDSHVHAPEHTSPGAQVKAPPGEVGSHGSPGSTMPFPHCPGTDVVVVDEVVVVDVVPLHSGGYGTNSGTARRSTQSTLNSVTQSTQSTMSCTSRIAPLQLLGAPGMVTPGHVAGNPMSLGERSSEPPHARSAPPHALQMSATFFASAAAIACCALPSPGVGHTLPCLPLSRASQHFCSAFDFASRNFVVSLPMARWHLLTADLMPNSSADSEP